jgi:hypothetical protein
MTMPSAGAMTGAPRSVAMSRALWTWPSALNGSSRRPNSRRRGEQRLLVLEVGLQLLQARLAVAGLADQRVEAAAQVLVLLGVVELSHRRQRGRRGHLALVVARAQGADGQVAVGIGEQRGGAHLLVDALDAGERAGQVLGAAAQLLQLGAQLAVLAAQAAVGGDLFNDLEVVRGGDDRPDEQQRAGGRDRDERALGNQQLVGPG